MSRIRGRDTGPELAVAAMLPPGWVPQARLSGKPDFAYVDRMVAVFVHGCFWHGHGCRPRRPVKSNAKFWAEKIRRNVERDASSVSALTALGWRVVIVWECEDPVLARKRVLEVFDGDR